MTTRRKAGALVAAVILILTAVLSGCGGGSKTDGNASGSTNTVSNAGGTNTEDTKSGDAKSEDTKSGESQTEGYTLPIVSDGSVTLTVATTDNRYAALSYTQNLPVWQEVEKRTGVKINWDVTPSSQYNSAMNIRLAAATDLPDIVKLPSDPAGYGVDGLIIPLNDLIDKYAPNIKKLFEDNPDLAKMMTAPDGNIYAIANIVRGSSLADPWGFLIRKDWLDKLGLKEPTNLDEWYTVLKAFKEQDPNGNGQADEIPLSMQYSWGGISLFGNALGLHLAQYSSGWWVEDGKVEYQFVDPRTKELLIWLNKLFNEGLLDPEFMTKKADKLRADITRELVGATNGFLNNTLTFESAIETSDADWIITVPPANEGVQGFYEKYGPLSGYYGITKDAKNPEVAIKWLDFIYASDEGAMLQAWGIEGKSYVYGADGQPEFTDFVTNNPDGLDPTSALRTLGAFGELPWIRNDRGSIALTGQPIALIKNNPEQVAQAERIQPYLIDGSPLKFIQQTEEEMNEEKAISADISTYLEESFLKFVYGEMSVEAEWDNFVKRMDELGLQKLIAIKQQQYDRYAASN
jgi:putative aldouronate transport system substrate-binding protein